MVGSGDAYLQKARFSGDVNLLKAIEADQDLYQLLTDGKAVGQLGSHRRHLLAEAVRVDKSLLPRLGEALENLRRRAALTAPTEAYVYSDPQINAAVMRGRSRLLIILSSGAVERLSAEELDFVIGHELGHALFGHVDVPAGYVLESCRIEPKQAMRLAAWRRKAEISADRAGLLCCGSLTTAATALFKTLSGLSIPGLKVDPHAFASQWDELAREVVRDASDQQWTASHPFPPLRMKALITYGECLDLKADSLAEHDPAGLAEADREVESLLAHMDPLAREERSGADPLLADFLLWGGLYVAFANGELDPKEVEDIRSLVGASTLKGAIAGGIPTSEDCYQRFVDAKAQRRTPVKALEVHRVFSGLIAIARADGSVDDKEIAALKRLAQVFGLDDNVVDLLLSQCEES